MTPEEKDYLDDWKWGALIMAGAELSSKQEEYAARPLADFNTLACMIASKTQLAFMEEFGIASVENFSAMSDEVKLICTIQIVSALNQALPVDYPYIVALVYSDQTPQLRICSMQRKTIPGWRDMVSPNVVPILRIKNTPIGESGGFNFTADDVEYICP